MNREDLEVPDYGITETCDDLLEQRDALEEEMEKRITELQDTLVREDKQGLNTEKTEKQLVQEQSRYAEEHADIQQKLLKRSAMEAGQPRYAKEIEDIRENVSEHLADKLDRKDRKYRNEQLEYTKNKLEYEKRTGETYHADPPRESELGGVNVETEIEMAREGITMDDLAEVSREYEGIIEAGDGYFRSRDRLNELLQETGFEEADQLLETGNREGKYTKEQYWNLKSQLRRFYGK